MSDSRVPRLWLGGIRGVVLTGLGSSSAPRSPSARRRLPPDLGGGREGARRRAGSFGKVLAAKNAAAAAERDEALRPILAELAGMSANAITAALNERGVPTPRGGPRHAITVIRVQRRRPHALRRP